MSTTNELVTQLNRLLQLTETEIMIAETRRSQAATDDIERELAANADKARERARLLGGAIRDLGAVPDAMGVVSGRLAATARTAAEQGVDLTEALLGDLGLEHELLDRARFARMLAVHIDETGARKVLDRLETAHQATIEWLMTRLAEVAVGGPVALRPTPVQSVIGFARRASGLPTRQMASVVNRSVELAGRVRERAGEVASTNVDRTRQLAEAATDIWTAGRDASLKRSEELARDRGDRRTAKSVHRTRLGLGAVDEGELPIRNYDELTAGNAIARIERLRDVDDVRAVLAYEMANKQRKGVTAAARERIEELSSELAAAS